jgi:hypothetical protein
MGLLLSRLLPGQARVGVYHNLTTKEPCPFYVEVHLLNLCVILTIRRRP